MLYIALKRDKRTHHDGWIDKLPPFVINHGGYLIHRVRFASRHTHSWGDPNRISMTYWCGGSKTSNCYPVTMTDDPPKDRLLCERCERLAQENGQLTADALAGRHVHTGKIIAVRTCCRPTN